MRVTFGGPNSVATIAIVVWVPPVGSRGCEIFPNALPCGDISSFVQAAIGGAPPADSVHALSHLLGVLTLVIALGRVLGVLCSYMGQPRLIGEMLVGVVLGPSVLGRLAPDYLAILQPASIAPLLGVVAQLGVILYMFLVGLELDLDVIRSNVRSTMIISHASIVVPFLLGSVLAFWIFESLAPAGVSFTSFALFMGIAMAITAFPVLARMLADRGVQKSDLGVLALSCAAVGDVTAWCLLAMVVGIAQSKLSVAVWTLAGAVTYLATMYAVNRLLRQPLQRLVSQVPVTAGTFAWLSVAILLSASITDWIGIHAVFGAFLLGVMIPHNSPLARDVHHRLHDLVSVLLLPAFFAVTGLRTQIGLLDNARAWWICGVIVLVATLGKVGGTMVAARTTGLGARTAIALGILMNTRGLMELIVLNVGLDLGIISPALFTMMVLMALATTMMTTPMLNVLERSGWLSYSIPGFGREGT